MNALLFPGQGSQVAGGFGIHNQFDLVKKIFKRADERLNLPITKIIFRVSKTVTINRKYPACYFNSKLLNFSVLKRI